MKTRHAKGSRADLLFAIFYVLTALATIVYCRRGVFGGLWDFIILWLLRLGAAGFLGWMFEQSLQTQASWPERWSLIGIIRLGLIMIISARFFLRSPFFHMPRESDTEAPARGSHRH